jgi:hypothetical protein
MQDEAFPLRGPGFIKRRRKEFAAAKAVMEDKGIAQAEMTKDPLIIEAKKKHFEDLCQLIQEWQRELGFKIDPAESWMQIFLPQHHDIGKTDYYETLGFSWEIKNGKIQVTFGVELSALFQCLESHLVNEEFWNNFTKLKQLIADGIGAASRGEEGRTYFKDAAAIVRSIWKELELALTKRVFSGKCSACPDA